MGLRQSSFSNGDLYRRAQRRRGDPECLSYYACLSDHYHCSLFSFSSQLALARTAADHPADHPADHYYVKNDDDSTPYFQLLFLFLPLHKNFKKRKFFGQKIGKEMFTFGIHQAMPNAECIHSDLKFFCMRLQKEGRQA